MTDEQRKRIHKIVYSCDDRAELAERIVRLEEENARLREYATKLEQTNDQLSNDNCDLLCDTQEMQLFIDENAKLRELCEDMLSCIEIREAFRRPPTAEMCKGFADRARELGIEVDE